MIETSGIKFNLSKKHLQCTLHPVILIANVNGVQAWKDITSQMRLDVRLVKVDDVQLAKIGHHFGKVATEGGVNWRCIIIKAVQTKHLHSGEWLSWGFAGEVYVESGELQFG